MLNTGRFAIKNIYAYVLDNDFCPDFYMRKKKKNVEVSGITEFYSIKRDGENRSKYLM